LRGGALPSRFVRPGGRKEGARGEVSDGAGAPYGDPMVALEIVSSIQSRVMSLQSREFAVQSRELRV